MWDENFPYFEYAAVEVWEGVRNFVSYFTGHLVAYPGRNYILLTPC